jgi:hypothetical protein
MGKLRPFAMSTWHLPFDKLLTTVLTLVCLGIFLVLSIPCEAAKRVDVFATGTVHSFGEYSVSGDVNFDAVSPGRVEIGRIKVEGAYNGPYPWIMRVYTENSHFQGIAGSILPQNRTGLVSKDGRYTVPLEINTPQHSRDKFITVPDISDPDYIPYTPAPQPNEASFYSDIIVIGVDPRNAIWVAGQDQFLHTDDDNTLGDLTLPTPFELFLKATFDEVTAQAEYVARLIIEVVSSP